VIITKFHENPFPALHRVTNVHGEGNTKYFCDDYQPPGQETNQLPKVIVLKL
jgi:hypothetical protein